MKINLSPPTLISPGAAPVLLPFINGEDPIFTGLGDTEVALNAMIVAANALNGANIFLGPRTYTINNPVVFNGDAIHLMGNGYSTVFQQTIGNPGAAVDMQATFDNNWVRRLRIIDVAGSAGPPIQINDEDFAMIENVDIEGVVNPNAGIEFIGVASENALVANNRITTAASNGAMCIDARLSRHSIIANNILTINERPGAINLGFGAITSIHSTIVGNHFIDTTALATCAIIADRVQYFGVVGNTFTNFDEVIRMDRIRYLSFSGNMMDGIRTTAFNRILAGTQIAVTGNVCANFTGANFWQGTLDQAVLAGNMAFGLAIPVPAANAIEHGNVID